MGGHLGGDADRTDTARMCVEFAAVLRRYGVAVGPSKSLMFYEAVHALGDLSLPELFWAGRAVFATDPGAYGPYALAFAEYFSGKSVDEGGVPAGRPPVDVITEDADENGPPPLDLVVGEEPRELPEEARLIAGEAELRRDKSFAAMSEQERREAARVIRWMRVQLDHRLSRRRTTARPGPFLDMRGTLRLLLSTDGEPARLKRRGRRVRQRPVTFLIDVSGSMTAYGHAILRFAHTLMRAGERVEVFTVGVRLHRVTGAMRSPSADRALERVGRTVTDWDGGTRLATSFSALLNRRQGYNALRGAVVVICSDGLDHDDPAEMEAVMSRLQRLSRRLVWLNPLKADLRYQPLARGMAAAFPYIDDFRAGHSIASLEELMSLLAGHGVQKKGGVREGHP